jgi:succinoglycan biosynthesis transport protein ExoP
LGTAPLALQAPSPPPEFPPEQASLDLRWMLGMPLRQWKLIVAVPLLMLLAAYGILKLIPPVYQSGVEILMYDPRQQDINNMGPQAHSTVDFDTIYVNTEIGVILSDSSLLRVVNDLKLYDNPEFQPHERFAGLRQLAGAPPVLWIMRQTHGLLGADSAGEPTTAGAPIVTTDDRAAAAIQILRKHLSVERSPLSYILDVSAKSSSPEMARLLAQTVVDDYFANQQRVRQRALDQLSLWLSAKIAALKARAAETQTAIEKLKAESGLTGSGGGSPVDREIAELNTQLMMAREDVADKKVRLEQASQASADGSLSGANLVDSPLIGQLRLQRSLLVQQREELHKRFGDGHTAVAAITDQLARVDQAISEETARIRSELQGRYDLAVRHQQSLEGQLQQLSASRGSSDNYVRLQQLQRVADADGKVYDDYLGRYNQVEASKAALDIGERIIAAAEVPGQPISPKKTLIMIAGGGLGLVFGSMLAFVFDFFGAGMQMGEHAEQTFGYPVIGNLPLFDRGRRSLRNENQTAMVQAVIGTPLSQLSEAVRAIRVGLHLPGRAHNSMVILVTSSLPGEGKSTVATLLAASSTAAGKRTILLDCDVRGRGASRNVADGHPGVIDLLIGTADLAEVTIDKAELGYAVIPAGTIMKSLGDLLSSGRMQELIEGLRQNYDCIVVDTPPLLSVVDALALATFADKILVTVDGRKTPSNSVAEALRVLRPESHRIAGIVFNKVHPEQMQRYGRYADAGYYQ